MHVDIPEVRSVVCSAYQGMVSINLLAKRYPLAVMMRNAAVEQWKFPKELFDDMFAEAGDAPPVPPAPD